MGTSLEELRALQVAESIADLIWERTQAWERFAQHTVGEQMVRAVDSIGANIAEAFGRYHYSEKINFLYYARGSLFETKFWINRAAARGLLPTEEVRDLSERLTSLAVQINLFVASLKQQRSPKQSRSKGDQDRSQLHEQQQPYLPNPAPPPTIFTASDLAWLNNTPGPNHP